MSSITSNSVPDDNLPVNKNAADKTKEVGDKGTLKGHSAVPLGDDAIDMGELLANMEQSVAQALADLPSDANPLSKSETVPVSDNIEFEAEELDLDTLLANLQNDAKLDSLMETPTAEPAAPILTDEEELLNELNAMPEQMKAEAKKLKEERTFSTETKKEVLKDEVRAEIEEAATDKQELAELEGLLKDQEDLEELEAMVDADNKAATLAALDDLESFLTEHTGFSQAKAETLSEAIKTQQAVDSLLDDLSGYAPTQGPATGETQAVYNQLSNDLKDPLDYSYTPVDRGDPIILPSATRAKQEAAMKKLQELGGLGRKQLMGRFPDVSWTQVLARVNSLDNPSQKEIRDCVSSCIQTYEGNKGFSLSETESLTDQASFNVTTLPEWLSGDEDIHTDGLLNMDKLCDKWGFICLDDDMVFAIETDPDCQTNGKPDASKVRNSRYVPTSAVRAELEKAKDEDGNFDLVKLYDKFGAIAVDSYKMRDLGFPKLESELTKFHDRQAMSSVPLSQKAGEIAEERAKKADREALVAQLEEANKKHGLLVVDLFQLGRHIAGRNRG